MYSLCTGRLPILRTVGSEVVLGVADGTFHYSAISSDGIFPSALALARRPRASLGRSFSSKEGLVVFVVGQLCKEGKSCSAFSFALTFLFDETPHSSSGFPVVSSEIPLGFAVLHKEVFVYLDWA